MKTTGLNQSLHQHRLAAGISVADVALKSGVPIKTIDRLEAGDMRWISLNQLRRITRTLKLRVTIELIEKRAGNKPSRKFQAAEPQNPESVGRGTN
jgi:transcriptional regulator with XRE-family HTH domain